MGIQQKMHKISVSMVTNMLPWQPKRGFEDQKNFLTAQIFPTYQSKYGREVGDGHRKKFTKWPFPW